MRLRLKRVTLPSFGVMTLLIGGILRLLSSGLLWPFPLVLASELMLLMSITWLTIFDFFPLLFPPFQVIKDRYRRRFTFFLGLVALFGLMQSISYLLPSGRPKDIATTVAFLSFISSILWIIGSSLFVNFRPAIKYLRRTPKEPERVTFSDIITSMAVILVPTVALSFIFSPPGLRGASLTPTQVFVSSLLTDTFMLVYLYLFVIRPHVFSWRQLGVRKVDREDLTHSFLLFLLISVAIVIIQTLLTRFHVPVNHFSFATNDKIYLVALVTILLTPFVEELYFRGFLFKGLMLHHRVWIAYLVSALVFAVLHPPLIVMLEVLVIGLLLAYVSQQSKSIWPNVLIHALNNALVIGYLYYK